MAEMAKTIIDPYYGPTVVGIGPNKAFGQALGDAIPDNHGFAQASYSSSGPYLNVQAGRSITSEYNRSDYDFRRKSEQLPRTDRDIMRVCNDAYLSVGIIRNVIDLMSDFGSQGIKLIHPNKKIERFYQKWFEKVNGKDRSERFLNQFYRLGNVVIERVDAKIGTKEKNKMSAKAAKDPKPFSDPTVKPNVIPGRYIFHAPMSIEHIGGEAAQYMGGALYAIKLPHAVTSKLSQNNNLVDARGKVNIRELLKRNVPEELLPNIMRFRILPLKTENVIIYHYKKDDWDTWAKSMLYSILSDVIALEKMKLADISALDGAISAVRIWKLGNLDLKIPPTTAGINRLRNILASRGSGGTVDLVWGPDLELVESNSESHKFLGPEKYQAILIAIYDGLGIPSALTVSSGSSTSTNGFISLKVLQERLQYGRDKLVDFWSAEIRRVQLAMGFARPAQVSFDHMILTDAQSELGLMVQLADRNIISNETLNEKFKLHPEIEQLRVRKEQKDRDKELDPMKAGPYHNPQEEHDLRKIALQRGAVTPSEVGLELDPKKEGEESFMDQQGKMQKEVQKFKPTGRPQDGRPKNSRDTQKRKSKVFVPQTSADVARLMVWATEAYKTISTKTAPVIFKNFNKKNVRSLTAAQKETMEELNFKLLCNINPYSDLNDIDIAQNATASIGSKDVTPTYEGIYNVYEDLVESFKVENNRDPNIDEKRSLQCSAYALSLVE